MAETVAIVSVISSATVAVTVPFINALLERTRFRWQAGEASVAEFRALLDSTLLLMHGAYALHSDAVDIIVLNNVPRGAQGVPDEVLKQIRDAHEAFTSTTDELYRDGLRLSLRLGAEAAVVKAHEDAVRYFQLAEEELAIHIRGGSGRLASFDETHHILGKSMATFMDAARTYVAPVQLSPSMPLRGRSSTQWH
jgi:hypothetical protein